MYSPKANKTKTNKIQISYLNIQSPISVSSFLSSPLQISYSTAKLGNSHSPNTFICPYLSCFPTTAPTTISLAETVLFMGPRMILFSDLHSSVQQ